MCGAVAVPNQPDAVPTYRVRTEFLVGDPGKSQQQIASGLREVGQKLFNLNFNLTG
jgi:hypothetical protein